jgi:hypothetical protein
MAVLRTKGQTPSPLGGAVAAVVRRDRRQPGGDVEEAEAEGDARLRCALNRYPVAGGKGLERLRGFIDTGSTIQRS